MHRQRLVDQLARGGMDAVKDAEGEICWGWLGKVLNAGLKESPLFRG